MLPEFVCPLLGYMEFLHNDWLRQILSWQQLSGCYGIMPKSALAKYYENDDYDYDVKKAQRPNNNDSLQKKTDGHEKAVVQQRGDKLVIYNGGKGENASSDSKRISDGVLRKDPWLDVQNQMVPDRRQASRKRKGFNVPKNKAAPELKETPGQAFGKHGGLSDHNVQPQLKDKAQGQSPLLNLQMQKQQLQQQPQRSQWTRRKLLMEKSLDGLF